jgi:hypothetical protein
MKGRIGLLILAACLPVVLVAGPASAAPLKLCEAFGNQLCLKAAGTAVDSPVVESAKANASGIVLVQVGGGHYQLQVAGTSHPVECVAATSSAVNIVLHHCDGGLGVNWIKSPLLVGPFTFENVEFDTRQLFLAGANSAGSQYKLKPMPTAGFNERFKFS